MFICVWYKMCMIEYHPFAQSLVVSALPHAKLQQHETNFLFLSVAHPMSVLSNLPGKPFSFPNFFLQFHCPEVPVCVEVCVYVCVWVCTCMCAYMYWRLSLIASNLFLHVLLKVVLLCGPPGLGKTTLAHIVAKHAGYNVVEMNAR